MKKLVIGNHSGGRFAFLDMSGRFKPKVWGALFRIGDRAAAHLWVLQWRKNSPNDRILIIDDPFKEGSGDAIQLNATWLFAGLADEVWLTEHKDEHIDNPGAYPLYHTNLWRIWHWLRQHKTVEPTIQPKAESLERAKQLLVQYKVPSRFATLQPLFDAGYNKHRNAPVAWWRRLAECIRGDVPLVMVGSYGVGQQFGKLDGVYPLWDERLSPMDSLALIRLSSVHAGGETGLTLWSTMFKRPTVALYAQWKTMAIEPAADCRPIPFGAPLEPAQLGGNELVIAEQVKRMLC